MEIEREHLGGVPIIRAGGQIDMSNYVEVHGLILAEIEEGHPHIVLNLRKVDFMDSAMLGMLLRSLDKAEQRGGLLVLVTNPFIDRILSVTGLTNIFDFFSNEDQAVRSVSERVANF